jgi:serine phosphatase RsbU (regulator of sigma subunit)
VEVQIGAAKVPKYASRESGDSLEIIERPHGGISAVLVDGQRSGRSAKIIANIVARKAISLLGEGVRDGAVARASHDYLRTHRSGQVSAELQIVSVDLVTRTLVLSRNSACPALLVQGGALQELATETPAIGIHANTKPEIAEWPLAAPTYLVVFTDGLKALYDQSAGREQVQALLRQAAMGGLAAQALADAVLELALAAADGRPRDDVSVLVVAVLDTAEPRQVRRLALQLPV